MKHRYFILLFGIIFLLCVIFMLISARNTDAPKIAEVYSGGELICEVDLGKITAPYEMPVKNGNGENIILFEHNSISVLEASCPDKLCVRQGKLNSSLIPIVCLPNKLFVKIRTYNPSSNLDAVSR